MSDGVGRSPSEGPRSSGLSHVTDGFRREGSARENDIPGMEDAAVLLLKGLEGLKGSQVCSCIVTQTRCTLRSFRVLQQNLLSSYCIAFQLCSECCKTSPVYPVRWKASCGSRVLWESVSLNARVHDVRVHDVRA